MPAPFTVIVAAAAGALGPEAMVRVAESPELMLAAESVAVAPCGRPATESAMGCEAPITLVDEIAYTSEEPLPTDCAAGERASEKSRVAMPFWTVTARVLVPTPPE